MKDFKKAAEAFSNAISGNPQNKDYYFNMGNACLEMQEYQSAIYHLKKVYELDEDLNYPNTEAALVTLASIYQDKTNDKKRALMVNKQIFKLYPDNKTAKSSLQKL